jgi:hypothetical protein
VDHFGHRTSKILFYGNWIRMNAHIRSLVHGTTLYLMTWHVLTGLSSALFLQKTPQLTKAFSLDVSSPHAVRTHTGGGAGQRRSASRPRGPDPSAVGSRRRRELSPSPRTGLTAGAGSSVLPRLDTSLLACSLVCECVSSSSGRSISLAFVCVHLAAG